MSKAREWSDRTQAERPRLNLQATDTNREPSLLAEVDPATSACSLTVVHGLTRFISIPHDFAAALGRFLVQTYSEPSDLLHGRPHDAKMREDHG